MNIKHPISLLTLTLTPFFMNTGCSSTGNHDTGTHRTATTAQFENIEQTDSEMPSTVEAQITSALMEVEETTELSPTSTQVSMEQSEMLDLEMRGIADANTELEAEEVLERAIEGTTEGTTESTTEPTVTNDLRPTKQVFRFGFNKAELTDEEKAIIHDHGQYLANHPSQNIIVHGHSDSQGDHKYNQFLSEKRAQHVAGLLKKAGAKKSQIEIFSWSSDSPAEVATNYKANRRVELRYEQGYFAQKEQ